MIQFVLNVSALTLWQDPVNEKTTKQRISYGLIIFNVSTRTNVNWMVKEIGDNTLEDVY